MRFELVVEEMSKVEMGVSDVVATGCDDGKIWNTGNVLYSRGDVAGPVE